MLVATHEHWDHLASSRPQISATATKVGEAWLAWTHDHADQLDPELRGERKKAMAALQIAANTPRMTANQALGQDEVDNADRITEMLGAERADHGSTTNDALNKVKPTAKPRYCRPNDAPVSLADTNARPTCSNRRRTTR